MIMAITKQNQILCYQNTTFKNPRKKVDIAELDTVVAILINLFEKGVMSDAQSTLNFKQVGLVKYAYERPGTVKKSGCAETSKLKPSQGRAGTCRASLRPLQGVGPV